MALRISLSRVHTQARRLGLREEGIVMVEFALVFPVLVALLLGVVEYGEAFGVQRRVDRVAATAAELASQKSVFDAAGFSDIQRVGNILIEPYPGASLALVVTSVTTDADNRVTVDWSCASGGATARAPGSAVTLGDGLTEPGSSLILIEARYQFTPAVGLYLTGAHDLRATAVFRPRLMKSIPRARGAC